MFFNNLNTIYYRLVKSQLTRFGSLNEEVCERTRGAKREDFMQVPHFMYSNTRKQATYAPEMNNIDVMEYKRHPRVTGHRINHFVYKSML